MTTFELLRKKYPENESVIVSEVSDSIGRNRYLDYMIINLWISRGQSIIGIEEKSSRSDWLRELKKPEKQERHAPFCDFFYLLTTKPNVAKIEEIPENWGWMEIKGERIYTIKKAPKVIAQTIPKHLWISIIRRAADKQNFVHKDSLKPEIDEQVERLIKGERLKAENAIKDYANLKSCISEFEKASGLSLRGSYPITFRDLGEKVKLVSDFNPISFLNMLERLNEKTQKAISEYKQVYGKDSC